MFILAAITLLALSVLSALTIWSAAVKSAEAAQIDEEQADD